MKILVVDDNRAIASLIQFILEEEGFQVMVAMDGEEGYAVYLFFEPDLVITDLHMPKRHGMELMKLIRSQNPGIKGIYMSADPYGFQPLLDEEIKKYGVGFLEKPFSRDELMKSLSTYISFENSSISPSRCKHGENAASSKTIISIGGRA